MNTELTILTFKRVMRPILPWAVLIIATNLFLVVSGCATAPQKATKLEEEKEYVWPAPPSQPVIKYLGEFNSSRVFDSKSNSGWKGALLGEEDERFWYVRSPYGISVDPRGRVLVADMSNPGVAVFDFEQKIFSIMRPNTPGLMEQPINTSVDRLGRVYVTDGRGKKVLVFDQNGVYLNLLGNNDEFERPVGVVVDNQRERVYVSDALKHHIAVFDFEGARISIIGKRGSDLGHFNFPLNLALDSRGHLYIVDSMNFRIQVFDPDTEEMTEIGQQGNNIGQFTRPKGIAIDSDDNLYVTDAAFANIQIFNSEGTLLMAFGSAGVGPGELNLPAGLAIDAEDKIYLADQANRRIQIFQYLGKPTTLNLESKISDQ